MDASLLSVIWKRNIHEAIKVNAWNYTENKNGASSTLVDNVERKHVISNYAVFSVNFNPLLNTYFFWEFHECGLNKGMDNVQCFVIILLCVNPSLKCMCMYYVYIRGQIYKLTVTWYFNNCIKKVNRSNICSIDKPLSDLLIFGFIY